MSKVTRAPPPFSLKKHIHLKKEKYDFKFMTLVYQKVKECNSCLLVTTWRMLTGYPDGSIPLFIALQFGNQSRINRPQVYKQHILQKTLQMFFFNV